MNTYDEDTMNRLRRSAARWRNHIKDPKEFTVGTTEDCPLCRRFWDKGSKCKGCPVKEYSGRHGCMGTPYVNWSIACWKIQFVKFKTYFNPFYLKKLYERRRATIKFADYLENLYNLLKEEE